MSEEILSRLRLLEEKYGPVGQDLKSYLDGLLYADFLTYWDYVHLDTLLSLQNPRTTYPDERIFIIYHQITELYFRLILDAISALSDAQPAPSLDLFKRQLVRINRYFQQLIQSFDIMVEGMDPEEFLKFRMSLLPASGFQSVQYRKIEMASTDLRQLVHPDKRELVTDVHDAKALCSVLYWRSGASDLASGKKTLTLLKFEEKYADELLSFAIHTQARNLRQLYLNLPPESREDPELIQLLREHDLNANVRWGLSHFKSAARYLDSKPKGIEATGGTNWQKYLPPRFQLVTFFPELWSAQELESWGTFH